jgi:leucyl aminopeptidase
MLHVSVVKSALRRHVLIRFTAYKSKEARPAKLVVEPRCNYKRVAAIARATFLVRDMINLPAEDMSPWHLHATAEALAHEFGARFSCITGDDLLRMNYKQVE